MIRSLYLPLEEDATVRELAERHGTSVNYIVRIAIRALAGLPVPSAFQPPPAAGAAEVTTSS